VQDFLLVLRAGVIEHDMANHDEQLFSLPAKPSGERVLAYNIDKAFAHPLPELLLRRPELFLIYADDSSSLLSRLPSSFDLSVVVHFNRSVTEITSG
jgi:hypothetical protein